MDSIPALLREHGLSPRKGLGQNFLAEPVALERIVSAAELTPADTVLEIGPGLGTLTGRLAAAAGRVVAVELDERMAGVVRERLAGSRNVEVIHGDIMELVDLGFLGTEYKVVANLPYYITSAVLRHVLDRPDRPRIIVVTVQREVAERIVAAPPDMSLLAVSVQFFGRPRIVARIPAGAFYPVPKVDSAVVRIDTGDQPQVTLPEGVSEAAFFRVVRAGFGQKRKTLRNSLSAGLRLLPAQVEEVLRAAGIDPRRRAETMSLEEWATVVARLP